jgi:hypothetical protein
MLVVHATQIKEVTVVCIQFSLDVGYYNLGKLISYLDSIVDGDNSLLSDDVATIKNKLKHLEPCYA